MSDNVDFDALARKTAESDGTMGDLNNLWGAAFALSEWHFIARGEMPNVRPYIASNAEYADGKQMIRAFTDTARLQRFASENNLTQADGSAQILSLPTEKLIDYLEQYIPYGVHGIWFNSDTGSDGFFLPLAQLRPVKEYLTKMNWQPAASSPETSAPEPAIESGIEPATAPEIEPVVQPVIETTAQTEPASLETLVVTVKDGLMLPSGFVSQASYACNFFCRVPVDWIEDGKLKSIYLEKIYQQVYGENWRMGNDDGSRYMVIDSAVKVLAPDEIKKTKWRDIVNTTDNHFWFYIASGAGEIKSVKAEEFQAHVDAATPHAAGAAAPLPAAAFATHGEAPGSEPAYFRKGEISFDTMIAPFEQKIASLLANYQGSGQYGDLLPLDVGAMEGLVENTARNAHGAYLRARHFFYEPEQGALVSVNTLDSNTLRPAGGDAAALLVNFALLKNLVNQAALLYFRFEGSKAEIQKLNDAFQPLLESCGFKENSSN